MVCAGACAIAPAARGAAGASAPVVAWDAGAQRLAIAFGNPPEGTSQVEVTTTMRGNTQDGGVAYEPTTERPTFTAGDAAYRGGARFNADGGCANAPGYRVHGSLPTTTRDDFASDAELQVAYARRYDLAHGLRVWPGFGTEFRVEVAFRDADRHVLTREATRLAVGVPEVVPLSPLVGLRLPSRVSAGHTFTVRGRVSPAPPNGTRVTVRARGVGATRTITARVRAGRYVARLRLHARGSYLVEPRVAASVGATAGWRCPLPLTVR